MFIFIWVLCGFVGGGLYLRLEWNDEDKITVNNLLIAGIIVMLGIIGLIIILAISIYYFIDTNGNKAIIYNKKKFNNTNED